MLFVCQWANVHVCRPGYACDIVIQFSTERGMFKPVRPANDADPKMILKLSPK